MSRRGSDRMRDGDERLQALRDGEARRAASPSRCRSRAISSAYSGFPPDAFAIRTSVGRGNVRRAVSRRCGATRRPRADQARDAPEGRHARAGPRAGLTRPHGEDRPHRLVDKRRSANSSADVEGGSSHWTSSIAITTARSSASWRRSDEERRPHQAGPGGRFACERSRAISSACVAAPEAPRRAPPARVPAGR